MPIGYTTGGITLMTIFYILSALMCVFIFFKYEDYDVAWFSKRIDSISDRIVPIILTIVFAVIASIPFMVRVPTVPTVVVEQTTITITADINRIITLQVYAAKDNKGSEVKLIKESVLYPDEVVSVPLSDLTGYSHVCARSVVDLVYNQSEYIPI